MSEFIECPFCSCLFLTEVDLELHLRVFSSDVDLHRRLLELVHKEEWMDFDEF